MYGTYNSLKGIKQDNRICRHHFKKILRYKILNCIPCSALLKINLFANINRHGIKLVNIFIHLVLRFNVRLMW